MKMKEKVMVMLNKFQNTEPLLFGQVGMMKLKNRKNQNSLTNSSTDMMKTMMTVFKLMIEHFYYFFIIRRNNY